MMTIIILHIYTDGITGKSGASGVENLHHNSAPSLITGLKPCIIGLKPYATISVVPLGLAFVR